jgi:SAM-dependent methyltransferase
MSEPAEIVAKEREFHNERFGKQVDPRAPLDRWYHAIRHGAEMQDRLVVAAAGGADVLEYGCAGGELSLDRLRLPEHGRSLVGIDISDVAIAQANERALRAGYDNSRFLAMDAHHMLFDGGSFDLVFGRGIIHHLDLARCYAEVARVLRRGGKAIFFEPMGHNPLLNLYRRVTPSLRTPDEHPLLASDFELARKYFEKVEVAYFGLTSAASALVPRRIRQPVYEAGRALDALLLLLPVVNRYAWYALITLSN